MRQDMHYHFHSRDEELRIKNELIKVKPLGSVRAGFLIWSFQLQGSCSFHMRSYSDRVKIKIIFPSSNFMHCSMRSQLPLTSVNGNVPYMTPTNSTVKVMHFYSTVIKVQNVKNKRTNKKHLVQYQGNKSKPRNVRRLVQDNTY